MQWGASIARVPGWFVAWLALAAAVVLADWLLRAGPVAVAASGATAIGLFVGLSEVLSRYRDAPAKAARSLPGILYILFNGAVSLLAFWFIREILPLWGEADAADASSKGVMARQALLAGLGAMAILRSSIMTARVGSKDVEVGPAAIIEIFRQGMDREIARKRAQVRAEAIKATMGQVSFVNTYQALTGISLTLLQNASAEEKAEIQRSIDALASQTGRSDRDKALELGLILADCVGFSALESSVQLINARSADNLRDRPVFVAAQLRRLSPGVVLRELAPVCLTAHPDVRGDQQERLAKEIDAINESALSEHAKVLSVGLLIASVLGIESLRTGVDLLEPSPPPPAPRAVGIPAAVPPEAA